VVGRLSDYVFDDDSLNDDLTLPPSHSFCVQELCPAKSLIFHASSTVSMAFLAIPTHVSGIFSQIKFSLRFKIVSLTRHSTSRRLKAMKPCWPIQDPFVNKRKKKFWNEEDRRRSKKEQRSSIIVVSLCTKFSD